MKKEINGTENNKFHDLFQNHDFIFFAENVIIPVIINDETKNNYILTEKININVRKK